MPCVIKLHTTFRLNRERYFKHSAVKTWRKAKYEKAESSDWEKEKSVGEINIYTVRSVELQDAKKNDTKNVI